ncbi:MAG: C1 family peptidase [Leptolyngbya sp. SIO1E4]|nr:C1 family peptidase [Leptolyngbya sp. SIO1E4]
MENSEALTNSFILCSYERFIYQFEYWFQTIEPFISAILQAISPLANFDNLKEAVNKGFERLDSGFQLHHLENRTRLAPYKTLLSEYSPIYLTDPIAELRSLKYSATNLFEETLVKIERELYGNIEIRPIFIDTLADFSRDRGVLSKKNKDAFLKKVEETVRSEFGYTEDELNTLVKPAAIKFLEFRTRPDRDKDAGEDLQNEKKDLEEYLSFFQFLKDILSNQYNVKYTRAQAESDKVDKQTAVLKSLLTDKEEFFEISHSDLDEQASKGSASSSKIQRTEQALFFEPARLQLPVSTKLLNTSLQRRKKNIKSYFFLPGVVDLSYWCSPVEDQGSLNACTAFAGIALVEYFARKRYGKYMNLSPRFLYKASRNLMGRLDDTGASVRQTMKALVLFGVPPEEVWPWNDQEFNEEPPAFCYAYAQSYQALKYFRLDSAAIASKELLLFQIKAVLAAGLPCMFGLTVYDSFYKESNIRRGHIPYPSDRDQIVGGHAAVAIGYSDYKLIDRVDGKPTQPGAILIRNSWGANWGNGGYGWLPYEYILQGLTADWWSLLKSEWFDGGAFGLGAVDPGATKNNGGGKDENHVTDPPTRT